MTLYANGYQKVHSQIFCAENAADIMPRVGIELTSIPVEEIPESSFANYSSISDTIAISPLKIGGGALYGSAPTVLYLGASHSIPAANDDRPKDPLDRLRARMAAWEWPGGF